MNDSNAKMPTSTTPLPSAKHWRLPQRTLTFGDIPLLMGIVNVTPDSFSDGGTFFDRDGAVRQALSLAAEGAAIIDVGGESTRPYSRPVETSEELRRVIPVIERIRQLTDLPISIDTSKSEVARAALAAGAEIINDVSGLESDSNMVAVANEFNAAVCVMHMQGNPQTMQDNPTYGNVVVDVLEYLQRRVDRLVDGGIARDRICVDPGIGFGKTHEHNLTIIGRCAQFHDLGQPVLIGHSRKGFIGKLMKSDAIADRDAGTLALSVFLAQQRIQMLRVHQVGPIAKALSLMTAVPGFFPLKPPSSA